MNLARVQTVALASMVGMSSVAAGVLAKDTAVPADGSSAPFEDPSASPPASASEIEAEIAQLHQPIDQERLSKIFLDVGRLADPQDQQRLQQMLVEQVQVLMEGAAPAEAPAAPGAPVQMPPDHEPGLSDEELSMRIDALNLGPTATADDLRARDEVVSAIAGVTDPIRREELLKRLDARERDADTAASPLLQKQPADF